jgi:hypothetical protein
VGYIGVTPEAGFTTGLLDRFTSTTGTTVTLTHEISSENDIIVFVNFVKQDSTNYSVGGSGNKTLTLGGTLVSSDVVEVHYLNIVNQTSAPSAGSVSTATINDLAVTGAKLNTDVISAQTELATAPDSTDELLVSDAGVLKRVDVSLVGGANTPAFSARMSSAQSISNNTLTKVDFDTEDFDTDSAYDHTTNQRFTVPSGKAGKYVFYACAILDAASPAQLERCRILFYKNGSTFKMRAFNFNSNDIYYAQLDISTVVDLSVGDYIEVYARINDSSGNPVIDGSSSENSQFYGYKLI